MTLRSKRSWLALVALAAMVSCADDEEASSGGAGGGPASSASVGSGGAAGGGGHGGSGAGGTIDPPPWCAAPAVQAASCERADVVAALEAASDGDTVAVPPGRCTWTEPASVDKAVSLVGAGEADTVIVADGADGLLDIRGNGGAFRLSSIGFTGNVTGTALSIDGAFSSLRVDHCAFTDIHDLSVLIGYYTWYTDAPSIRALFDHITYTNDEEHGFLRTYGKDDAWERPDDLGGADAIYIEDSTFTWATPGVVNSVNDGEHGTRTVVRHNTVTNGALQWHDTGSTPQARGTRAVELYANTFLCSVDDCGWGAVSLRGGTGLAFDNDFPIYPGGFSNAAVTEIYRVAYDGGEPWTNRCDGVVDRICSSFRSHCSGGDHRTCGADGNECAGIGSCVDACGADAECPAGETCLTRLDGHQDGTGWPCRDQTGRGMDDPVTHEQASAPFYWWNNRDQGGALAPIYVSGSDTDFIQKSRDYFEQGAAFDGSSGVGRGPRADRPDSCNPGVGFFATDEGRLYVCSTGDAWDLRFEAYPYPHPLQSCGD